MRFASFVYGSLAIVCALGAPHSLYPRGKSATNTAHNSPTIKSPGAHSATEAKPFVKPRDEQIARANKKLESYDVIPQQSTRDGVKSYDIHIKGTGHPAYSVSVNTRIGKLTIQVYQKSDRDPHLPSDKRARPEDVLAYLAGKAGTGTSIREVEFENSPIWHMPSKHLRAHEKKRWSTDHTHQYAPDPETPYTETNIMERFHEKYPDVLPGGPPFETIKLGVFKYPHSPSVANTYSAVYRYEPTG